MDNSIKTFKCDKCNNIKNHIIWKNIAKNNIFMCELCWKKFDLKLNYEILHNLKILNIK
jgi:hypothetical protein